MSITKFQPTVWSAQLLSVLSKSLVYAGSPCVNRNYEGEISGYGDTVKVVSITDPSIVDYTKYSDLSIEALTDAEQNLVIDQSKAFAFEIDDIDMRQARSGGALMTEAAQRSAFGLRDVADTYVAGKMAVAAGNALGVIDVSTTSSDVYDKVIIGARTKLAQNNVPTEGRWLVVDPSVMGKLLLDSRFIKANESGSADSLRNGFVGRAGGFDIFESNNAPVSARTGIEATTTNGDKDLVADAGTFNQGDVGLAITGTGIAASSKVASVSSDGTTATLDKNASASATVSDIAITGGGAVVIAGSSIATSYAEQINKVEAFRPEKRFTDALKGLHLYGAKVFRPEALVVSSVKTA